VSSIGLINCGSGNYGSVRNALRFLGLDPLEVRRPADLDDCHAIILPGVGAFPTVMRRLREAGLDEGIRRDVLDRAKPYLGICVGMQILADTGEEFGPAPGLGLIPGTVEPLRPTPGHRVPHIGWNTVRCARECPLFDGLDDEPSFYFVHGFAFRLRHDEHIAATTDHGGHIVAAVHRDNIFGVQFHPEKSQRDGLALLRRFAALALATLPLGPRAWHDARPPLPARHGRRA
jgi:imidazole glycerol-phosphate synthase subunit HisH